ncbi:uncharacterized protein A4U43_C10F1040 [Asparagus officinalis]|uniref:Uncharacterized protein n=1 Tax=Asparagus officinalis TaxID=4686 RepID=A0A5P1E1G4_ASPOF|nr:uncharacterized protein A4U43_C10F1040 [Asparagus officinalis]
MQRQSLGFPAERSRPLRMAGASPREHRDPGAGDQGGEADRSSSRSPRSVHLIPVLTVLCFLILYLISYEPSPLGQLPDPSDLATCALTFALPDSLLYFFVVRSDLPRTRGVERIIGQEGKCRSRIFFFLRFFKTRRIARIIRAGFFRDLDQRRSVAVGGPRCRPAYGRSAGLMRGRRFRSRGRQAWGAVSRA